MPIHFNGRSYANFKTALAAVRRKHPDWSLDRCRRYTASLMRRQEPRKVKAKFSERGRTILRNGLAVGSLAAYGAAVVISQYPHWQAAREENERVRKSRERLHNIFISHAMRKRKS